MTLAAFIVCSPLQFVLLISNDYSSNYSSFVGLENCENFVSQPFECVCIPFHHLPIRFFLRTRRSTPSVREVRRCPHAYMFQVFGLIFPVVVHDLTRFFPRRLQLKIIHLLRNQLKNIKTNSSKAYCTLSHPA